MVLGRVVRLTPGKHRLELFDTRNGEYQIVMFEVREGDMTIELRFSNEHAELRTYYSRVVYMQLRAAPQRARARGRMIGEVLRRLKG